MLAWPPEQSPELGSWEVVSDAGLGVPEAANAFAVVGPRLAQRIGATHHVALLPYTSLVLPRTPDVQSEPDIDALWPQHGVPVDMLATIPADFLAQRYDDAVWGSAPLALFPKQVLAKARSALALDAYTAELRKLLVAPAQIDHRYSQDPDVETRAQAHRVDMVPIGQVLQQVRHRETQLQVVVGLELLPDAPEIEPTLDHHFDRLCIWQAVSGNGDALGDFCSAVLLPYFRTRCPHKTKEYIKRSRGTVKTRSRKPVKSVPAQTPLPSGGGLLKALQITGTALAPPPLPTPSAADAKSVAPKARPTPAARSASHPLYTMASRQNTVEVRFKRSRRSVQGSAASGAHGPPGPPLPLAEPASVSPSPLITSSSMASPASAPQSALPSVPQSPPSPPPLPAYPVSSLPVSANTKVQATPKKERTKFLESLNQPIPIDFDTVESTDSDE